MPLGRPTKQETPWNESIYVRWQRACNAFRRLRLFFCIDMPELETLALFLLEFGESEGGFYESAAVDHSILLEAPRQTSSPKDDQVEIHNHPRHCREHLPGAPGPAPATPETMAPGENLMRIGFLAIRYQPARPGAGPCCTRGRFVLTYTCIR